MANMILRDESRWLHAVHPQRRPRPSMAPVVVEERSNAREPAASVPPPKTATHSWAGPNEQVVAQPRPWLKAPVDFDCETSNTRGSAREGRRTSTTAEGERQPPPRLPPLELPPEHPPPKTAAPPAAAAPRSLRACESSSVLCAADSKGVVVGVGAAVAAQSSSRGSRSSVGGGWGVERSALGVATMAIVD